MRLVQLLSVLLAFVTGCPAEPMPGEDAPIRDDAPADTDRDGDGTPDAVDCDPASPAVGRTGTRACDGECGAGTEACSEGVWAACVPTRTCLCTTEGERRITSCGNCGEQSEACLAGRWMPVSMCLNAGCMPGAVETRTGDFCMEEQRLCSAMCEWSDWSVTHPMGTCLPGARSCLPPDLDRYCDNDCMWVNDDICCPPQDPPLPGCEG